MLKMQKAVKKVETNTAPQYVAYFRVSTIRQGKSGLGIDAQRRAVADYTQNCKACVIAEFEEHESGKNNDRVKLNEALKLCQKTGATLIIAKLDRLSRNAAFILTLSEKATDKKNGFKIVFCDMPDIDETMLGMLAIFAQHERKIMSNRQLAAYESKRLRGVKLGYAEAFTPEVRAKAVQARKDNREVNENLNNAKKSISKEIRIHQSEGKELTAQMIVKELNRQNIKTIRSLDFELKNVRPIIKEVLQEMGLTALPKAAKMPTQKKEKNDTTTAATVAKKMRDNKKTFAEIANFLNDNGFMTAKKAMFEPMSVKRLIEK